MCQNMSYISLYILQTHKNSAIRNHFLTVTPLAMLSAWMLSSDVNWKISDTKLKFLLEVKYQKWLKRYSFQVIPMKKPSIVRLEQIWLLYIGKVKGNPISPTWCATRSDAESFLASYSDRDTDTEHETDRNPAHIRKYIHCGNTENLESPSWQKERTRK